MKFIQDERLAAITACLTEIHPINHHGSSNGSSGSSHSMSDRILFGRMEAFTTKRARTEKLMAQSISDRYWNQAEADSQETSKTSRSSKRGARRRSQSVSSILKAPSICNGSRRLRATSFDVSSSSSARRRRRQVTSSHGVWCRRTYTDLILTLQASFPDYDFGNVEPHYFVSMNVRLALTRIQEKLADYNNSMDMDTLSSSLLASLHNQQPGSDKHQHSHHNSMVQVYSFCPPWEWQGDDAPSMNHFITESLVSATAQHSPSVSDAVSDAVSDSIVKTEWQLSFSKQHVSDNMDTRPSNNSSDTDSNPLVPLWNFNYFFVNKTLKRIVFFTCVETMTRIPNQSLHSPHDHDADELLLHQHTHSSSLTNDMNMNMGTNSLTPVTSRSLRLISDDFSHSITSKSKYTANSRTRTANQGAIMISPTIPITDTATFAGYYSVTDDDDNDHDLLPIEDDEDEDEEGLDNDEDDDEGPSKQFWVDDYDMDGDAMGQEAPPITVA